MNPPSSAPSDHIAAAPDERELHGRSLPGSRAKRDRKVSRRPAETRVERDPRVAVPELEVVEPVDQLTDRDTEVQAGHVRTGATVGSDPEGEVTVARSVEIEVGRAVELVAVAVGRHPRHEELVALL